MMVPPRPNTNSQLEDAPNMEMPIIKNHHRPFQPTWQMADLPELLYKKMHTRSSDSRLGLKT